MPAMTHEPVCGDQGLVTQLLVDWGRGDASAFERLAPLIYDELRRLAHGHLYREKRDLPLQTTALVHEAYLRLAAQGRVFWRNRAHFYAIAGLMMRRVLMDRVRRLTNAKRGGAIPKIRLNGDLDAVSPRPPDLVALDDALDLLAAENPRWGMVVEPRFFAGLKNDEIARVLGISTPTVTRTWRAARAWLYRHLSKEAPLEPSSPG